MNLPVRLSLRFFLSILLFCPSWLCGQTATAWALDPHAGLHGALLQPAATAATPYAWDLNLAGISALLANDYVFARRTSALSLLRALRGQGTSTLDDPNRTFSLNGRSFRYDYPTGNRRFFARTGVEVLGPSFSLRVGENTRLGLFTRVRGMASTRQVDADLNYNPYFSTPNGINVPIDAFGVAAALWGETGIHFAQAILLNNDAALRLGGNLRYLVPAEGANANNSTGGSLRRVPGDSLVLINVQADVELTNGWLEQADAQLAAGQGFAADLGLQYAWESMADGDYRYTAGLSLLDLGQLNFNNGTTYRFNNTGEVLLVGDDYDPDDEAVVAAALEQFGRDVNGNIAFAPVPESFSVGLPAAISAQFSYRPVAAVQLAVVYRGDLPGANNRLSQGQAFTLAAHYSKWWYGGGMTAGITEWQQFQLGGQLRLGPLYLGTDRLLGSLLPRAALREGDFFIGLRLHDFGGEQNRGQSKNRGRSGRGSKVKCYTF